MLCPGDLGSHRSSAGCSPPWRVCKSRSCGGRGRRGCSGGSSAVQKPGRCWKPSPFPGGSEAAIRCTSMTLETMC